MKCQHKTGKVLFEQSDFSVVLCDYGCNAFLIGQETKGKTLCRPATRDEVMLIAWALGQEKMESLKPPVQEGEKSFGELSNEGLVHAFLEEHCVSFLPNAFVAFSDLYSKYKYFMSTLGKLSLSKKTLGFYIKKEGFEQGRTYINGRQTSVYFGLAFKENV